MLSKFKCTPHIYIYVFLTLDHKCWLSIVPFCLNFLLNVGLSNAMCNPGPQNQLYRSILWDLYLYIIWKLNKYDVWFVRIGQYMAEIQLFEYLESEKKN